MRVRGVRGIAFVCAIALALAACSGDDDSDDAASEREIVDLSGAEPATFVTHGSVEQVWLTGADASEELRLVDARQRAHRHADR